MHTGGASWLLKAGDQKVFAELRCRLLRNTARYSDISNCAGPAARAASCTCTPARNRTAGLIMTALEAAHHEATYTMFIADRHRTFIMENRSCVGIFEGPITDQEQWWMTNQVP